MKPPIFKPLLPWASLIWLLAVLSPLKAADSDEGTAPEPPRVLDGRSLEFPDKSPQLSGLKTTEVRAVRENDAHFTGRLTWNEDYTVRIYSPVTGRVAKVVALIGQKVQPGDDLALLHSSDYGQAL